MAFQHKVQYSITDMHLGQQKTSTKHPQYIVLLIAHVFASKTTWISPALHLLTTFPHTFLKRHCDNGAGISCGQYHGRICYGRDGWWKSVWITTKLSQYQLLFDKFFSYKCNTNRKIQMKQKHVTSLTQLLAMPSDIYHHVHH